MGRLIGIDYGVKRVGIAMADPLGMFAQPYGTFSPDDAMEAICLLESREGLTGIVVGWPLLPDGSEGESTSRVQQYINRIRKRLPHVDIIKWDERYSSEEAKTVLARTGNASLRRSGKGRIDVAAAGIILGDYLAEKES